MTYFQLKTENFAVYNFIFTDTIFQPNGLNISGVTVNIGILVPGLTSEAPSDHAKFCCIVSALYTL